MQKWMWMGLRSSAMVVLGTTLVVGMAYAGAQAGAEEGACPFSAGAAKADAAGEKTCPMSQKAAAEKECSSCDKGAMAENKDCASCEHGDMAKSEDCATCPDKGTCEGCPEENVVSAAAQHKNLRNFLLAVSAAGLDDLLKTESPITVFAPSNNAFAQLDDATFASLLADRDALRAVLMNHVVPARITAADAAKLTEAKAVSGADLALKADTESGELRIQDARITSGDILASNGIVHVIDRVIMPVEMPQETAQAAGQTEDKMAAAN